LDAPVTKYIDEAALRHSVFSEAFLVGVDVVCQPIMDGTALRWALFEILDVPTLMFPLH